MKVDKYDRQIRLWGVQGQRRLSTAKVALLGCSGSGIELLKNVVLPGIAQVDIFDTQLVQVSDLNSSFFYGYESVGGSKGQEALKNLLEMNPDVLGLWHNYSILDKPQAINKYNIVISCDNTDDYNRKLSELCWSKSIPVIFSSSVGFMFYIRIQTQHHYIQNQSTEEGMYYLRLSNPFQQLLKYSQQWDIPTLLLADLPQGQEAKDNEVCKILNKIPYPIILLQAYQHLPQQERKIANVKALINQWISKLNSQMRGNFREALSKVFDLFRTPDNFLLDISILESEYVVNATQKSHIFCIFLKAVGIYYHNTKTLPQPTQLPDIETSSALYIQLKNAYKKQHQNSKQSIITIINQLYPNYMVDDSIISNYIENIRGLQILKTNSYVQQLNNPNHSNINQSEQKNVYIALRAYELFRDKHKAPPTPTNYNQLLDIAKQYITKHNIKGFDERFIHQIARSQGKQFISISSMVGAIGAQEAIKMITNCFCPMMNGYVFNGITSQGVQIAV